MTLEHIALWTGNLEAMRNFYQIHFGAKVGPRYQNRTTGFESYFLSFEPGTRIEIMQHPDISRTVDVPGTQNPKTLPVPGYAHLALSVGDERAVDELTNRLATAGVTVLSQPRRTGDGYYESQICDPDGNIIELVATS